MFCLLLVFVNWRWGYIAFCFLMILGVKGWRFRFFFVSEGVFKVWVESYRRVCFYLGVVIRFGWSG